MTAAKSCENSTSERWAWFKHFLGSKSTYRRRQGDVGISSSE